MKKINAFIFVLAIVVAFSSCQSKLNSKSSSQDSISYAVGILWGSELVQLRISDVDIDNVFDKIQQALKRPATAENDPYAVEYKLSEYLKKQPSASNKEFVEYSLGVLWANQFKQTEIKRLSISYAKQAIRDLLSGDTTKMQMNAIQASKYMFDYKKVQVKAEAAKRLEDGRKFLAENKKRDGVVELESGLQYQIIEKGNDVKAVDGDTINLNILTQTIDGDTISPQKNQHIIIGKTSTIKAFDECLPMFGEGAKYKLFVPTELAFGSKIDPWINQAIKPNAALLYDVEIKKIGKVKHKNK